MTDKTMAEDVLDKTIDIDERRLIRTAIRELRRCEIEEMEAALTSKRFRRAHQHRHEDKENQCCPDLTASLDMLSGKIQAIHDIEELTGLLRSTSEYEERKLIRAAIRRLRDEEIRGALEKVQTAGQRTERRQNPQSSFDLQVSKCGVVNIGSVSYTVDVVNTVQCFQVPCQNAGSLLAGSCVNHTHALCCSRDQLCPMLSRHSDINMEALHCFTMSTA
ncbi:Smoothelin [Anabarilius grahami]|uniref:Smoothelin n=1 Tax=Anabarilius grahami TaxID=495550 RepID=A0A3N0YDZ2_ANAGA|nr:Smoothelin [Anabarilius grahami]